MTQKTNESRWTMDVRVRERNLQSGSLAPKDLEQYLAQLPDLADQAEPFTIAQPALEQPAAPAQPAAEPATESAPATNGEGAP